MKEKPDPNFYLTPKNGIWHFIIHYFNDEGKPKDEWHTTHLKVRGNKKNAKKIAQAFLDEYKCKYIFNSAAAIKTVSDVAEMEKEYLEFGIIYEEWLNSPLNIKQNTLNSYRWFFRKYIDPYFSEKCNNLNNISNENIESFYTYLSKNCKLSNSTVLHVHANLSKFFKYCINKKYITQNPMNDVERPKKGKSKSKKFKTYSSSQLDALQKASIGEDIAPAVLIAANTGLRRSEVLGLKWDAVDFDNQVMTIRHTIVNCKSEEKLLLASDELKTDDSYRSLPLKQELLEYLLALKAKQEENKKTWGNAYNMRYWEYICVMDNGDIIKPDHVSHKFQLILKKNNLPKIRFHDLRHTFATLYLKNKGSLKKLQRWLGHSSIRTTADIYSHVYLEDLFDLKNEMNQILPPLPEIPRKDSEEEKGTGSNQKILLSDNDSQS